MFCKINRMIEEAIAIITTGGISQRSVQPSQYNNYDEHNLKG
jgi:hypothetical protein